MFPRAPHEHDVFLYTSARLWDRMTSLHLKTEFKTTEVTSTEHVVQFSSLDMKSAELSPHDTGRISTLSPPITLFLKKIINGGV